MIVVGLCFDADLFKWRDRSVGARLEDSHVRRTVFEEPDEVFRIAVANQAIGPGKRDAIRAIGGKRQSTGERPVSAGSQGNPLTAVEHQHGGRHRQIGVHVNLHGCARWPVYVAAVHVCTRLGSEW